MTTAALSAGRRRQTSFAVFVALALLWQVLSVAYPVEAAPGEPMVPGWQVLFTRTLLSMADYWQGGLGVPSVAEGAERTYLAAVLSLLSHTLATLLRLACGLLLGWLAGLALGLAVSWSPWSRRLVELPLQFVRTLPLLAMVPLFQLWFGTFFLGQILFVAYGIGVIVFAGAVNAVRNVPQIYIDNARTLGASQMTVYRTIILPAILPEMRSTVLLSLGTGWGAVLGAEYLGAQSGLGYIIVYAAQFAYLDRMFLIALLFILYTSLSYWAAGRITGRMLEWAVSSYRQDPP
jgi:sulfonate transport system permease protein